MCAANVTTGLEPLVRPGRCGHFLVQPLVSTGHSPAVLQTFSTVAFNASTLMHMHLCNKHVTGQLSFLLRAIHFGIFYSILVPLLKISIVIDGLYFMAHFEPELCKAVLDLDGVSPLLWLPFPDCFSSLP